MSWVANPRSRLFETDRVEMALEQIMLDQGLPAQRKREADTNTTPRIELDLEPTGMTGNRFALNNGGLSQFQPFNVWKFNLAVAIVTNRQTNDADHLLRSLESRGGNCRWRDCNRLSHPRCAPRFA